jgi:hypothetical protein
MEKMTLCAKDLNKGGRISQSTLNGRNGKTARLGLHVRQGPGSQFNLIIGGTSEFTK